MSRRLDIMKGSPTLHSYAVDKFRGVDLTSAPINVAEGRAFNAPNMIRDTVGKVRKRMGYEIYRTYADKINGIFQYGDHVLVHAGQNLYLDGTTPTLLGSSMANHKSNAFLMTYEETERDLLMILDGTTLWCYFEGNNLVINSIGTSSESISEGLHTAASMATIPQVTVGRAPDGEGGDSLDMVNMLTDKYCDSFLGTATATVYQLSFFPLSSSTVTAYKISSGGTWSDITSTVSSVDTTTGKVTFSTAPGEPPVSGEDNVMIVASSTHTGYSGRINGCQFGIIYGVAGAWDRLFVSGNPSYPDTDWYCNSANPLFWGDWNYGEIGKTTSPITGYTIVNGYLATHKEADDTDRNCYLRTGEMTYQSNEGNESVDLQTVKFPITNIIQGTGAIAPASFAYMTEPLYLTLDGIYATTPYEGNGILYAQKRSRLLEGALLNEPHANLKAASAVAYKEFYMLAVGDKVYILDTLQRDTSGLTKGSQYQYEGYHWQLKNAVRCWFKKDQRLYFGAEDGNVYRFFSDTKAGSSYEDNGNAISAAWEFMHVGRFHFEKTVKWFAINGKCTAGASIHLLYRKTDEENYGELTFEMPTAYFSYSAFSSIFGYSGFFYGGSENPRTIGRKLKMKKYDSCILSIRNENALEGFSLYALVLEYIEGLHYKDSL